MFNLFFIGEKILGLVLKAFGYYHFPVGTEVPWGKLPLILPSLLPLTVSFHTYGVSMAAAFHMTRRSFTKSEMLSVSAADSL